MHVDTPGNVRQVSVNPRHDVCVNALSTVDGDLDFDGETDGLDLLRCSHLVGKKYDVTHSVGLHSEGETFDPRCDVDGDVDIDDDIEAIASHFGVLR